MMRTEKMILTTLKVKKMTSMILILMKKVRSQFNRKETRERNNEEKIVWIILHFMGIRNFL